MKKNVFVFILMSFGINTSAQETAVDTSRKKEYRETAEKINDLMHTKLEVKPDFSKSYLYGKSWLTLRPHFYPTDSLRLDAKGMTINKVALLKGTQQLPLKYEYDDWSLRIKLDKTYKSSTYFNSYLDWWYRRNISGDEIFITWQLGLCAINANTTFRSCWALSGSSIYIVTWFNFLSILFTTCKQDESVEI